MAKGLEELIRAACDSGGLNHLTLSPSHRREHAKTGKVTWQASYRDTDSTGYRVEHADDPVEALALALNAAPPPRQRAPRAAPGNEDLDFG